MIPTDKADPAIQEFARLGLAPTRPSHTIRNVRLSDADYARYEKEALQEAYTRVNDVMDKPNYQIASDERQRTMLNAAIDKAHAKVADDFITKDEAAVGKENKAEQRVRRLNIGP